MMMGERDHTRRRYPAATRDANGFLVRGTPVDTTIRAAVQPASGRQLERLPEGLRSAVTKVAYTFADLRTADQATAQQPDEMVVDGEVFQVERVVTYDDTWPVTEAYLQKVGP